MNLSIMSCFFLRLLDFRLLKYILPVFFLGIVLWGSSVEAGRYSIQNEVREDGRRVMIEWRESPKDNVYKVLNYMRWESDRLTDDLVAEILLRAQTQDDAPIVDCLIRLMESEFDRNIEQIERAYTDSSRRNKGYFHKVIEGKLKKIKALHQAQQESQAKGNNVDVEGESDDEGKSDDEGVRDYEEDGGEKKSEPVSSLAGTSGSFMSVPTFPLCDCNGASPSAYTVEVHEFNVENIKSHLTLVGNLLLRSELLHKKLSSPGTLTRSKADALSFVDVDAIVKLLVSSGKLELIKLFPVLLVYDKEKPVGSRITQLRKLRQILLDENPFKFPQDKKELLLPLVMLRQIQLSTFSGLHCVIPTEKAEKAIALYMNDHGSEQPIALWEKVYSIIDGLNLTPASDHLKLKLNYQVAEAALKHHMADCLEVTVENMSGVISEIEKVTGSGLREKKPGDLLALLQHACSSLTVYQYPCITVFQILFRHGVTVADRGGHNDRGMFNESGEETYAAEIPQQAVKGKFSEIIKKITGREEIEALAAISLDSFGFCPAELLKSYQVCSGCYVGLHDADPADSMAVIEALVYDRTKPFTGDSDIDQRLKVYGAPSGYDNWWLCVKALGFECRSAFNQFETDEERFWHAVNIWISRTAFEGFNDDGKGRDWQSYGRAIQKMDREKGRDILRGVWFAYYKVEAATKISCPEVLLMRPARGHLSDTGPFGEMSTKYYDLVYSLNDINSNANADLIVQNLWLRLMFFSGKYNFESEEMRYLRDNQHSYYSSNPRFWTYGKDWMRAVLFKWVGENDSLWIDPLIAIGEFRNLICKDKSREKCVGLYSGLLMYLEETANKLPQPVKATER